jgi:hypothetical protein
MTSTTHRIAFYADIFYDHRLSGPYWIPPANLDVEAILLGGDINYTPERLAAMLQEIRESQHQDTHIVAVPGNGEYINFELSETRARYRDLIEALPNTHFLDDRAIVLPSGVRVIGSTLWSHIPPELVEAFEEWVQSDEGEGGDKIRLGERPLTIDDSNELHSKAVAFIERELKGLSAEERRRTVVCTHYWPTARPWLSAAGEVMLPAWWPGALTDLDALITDCGPGAWLCGHIHECKHVTVAQTLVAANARTGDGPDNVNPDFRDRYVVELPAATIAYA